MDSADKMSCDAMIRLAKAEVARNDLNYGFAASSPACAMNAAFADRKKEMDLLAGNGIARNLCFDPASLVKWGDWEEQFKMLRPVPQVFDARTRPR